MSEPAFIDPEDIPFGKEPQKKPIYALVWTWRNHRVFKNKGGRIWKEGSGEDRGKFIKVAKPTKKPWQSAEHKMMVWKRWYERNGWKVVSHADGYFAAKDNLRHAIVLHEYDPLTRERLK